MPAVHPLRVTIQLAMLVLLGAQVRIVGCRQLKVKSKITTPLI